VDTRVVPVDPAQGPWPALEDLAGIVRDGGLVAFPTETVYGIAVNARDEAAVRRLYQAKGRDEDKPLTVHLAETKDLNRYVRELPLPARKLADRFWPGPLTLVVSDRHGRPTGFRVPDLAVTREFLRLADCRVAASSANPSGSEPARTAEQVLRQFDGVLDAVIDGGECRHGKSSTVVRVLPEGDPEVLRADAIPESVVREATARLLLFVCSGNRCRSPFAAAMATRLLSRRLGVEEYELLDAGYRIESAGTGCLRGQPATPEAESVARDRGLDLAQHRSRALTLSLVEEADEIYVMTKQHRDSILEFAPDAAPRIKPLDRRSRDIPDPYGHGMGAYEKIAEVIHIALMERLDDL
jgi:tRNA threonylcarbamoyl adenosine modification protein (Sua5/YciO/YrdC/YwlC family)